MIKYLRQMAQNVAFVVTGVAFATLGDNLNSMPTFSLGIILAIIGAILFFSDLIVFIIKY